MALPDVVVIQSVEGLNRTQRMTVSQVRQSSSCSTAFKRRCQLFSCLQTQAETSVLPGSPVCQTRPETRSTPHHWLSCFSGLWTWTGTCSPGPPACQLMLWISGLAPFHNCASQFLTINSFYTYSHPIDSVSLENTKSYSKSKLNLID